MKSRKFAIIGMATLACILLAMSLYGSANQQGQNTKGIPQLVKHWKRYSALC